MSINRWSQWRPFPDPECGDYLIAPFGPGVYELGDSSTDELILCGKSKNVAYRMSSLLPSPLGAGTRKNSKKRQYVFRHLTKIEYRTMACADEDDAWETEAEMRSKNEYRFPI